MKPQLFIKLPADAKGVLHWGEWLPDEQQWSQQGELLAVDLVALAEQSNKHQTIVIVPATQVSYKRVGTPAKQVKQIQRAVPYMIEEQLASPVDQLHFAYGKRDKNGEVDVYWATHRQMEQWLDWFEQAEVKVDAVVSELALLKAAEDASEVYLFDNTALVSNTDGSRWACQRDLFSMLWQSEHPSSDDDEIAAEQAALRVFHSGELESFWSEQQQIFSQALTDADLLQLLVQQFSRDSVNLLQQNYTPKKESNLQLKKYRPMATMFAAALVVFLGYQGSQYFVLKKENTVLQEQASSLFRKVFSKRPRAGSILGQTQRLAKRGQSSSTQGLFLSLLEKFSGQLANVSQIKTTSITFDNKKSELRVDVLAPDYQTLNSFKDALLKSGLKVDMSSASAQGEQYSTRLVVRSGS